jgi:hypothetical protein
MKTQQQILTEKNTKLVRTNHHFQKWQVEWLDWHKKETGTAAAELLRRLLNEYIRESKK